MDKQKKIQCLLVNHLLEKGHIQLMLPDGMTLEVGTVQENEKGELQKTDNYCWVIASQKDRQISMDSYNFSLRYTDKHDKIIFEDDAVDDEGNEIKILEAI